MSCLSMQVKMLNTIPSASIEAFGGILANIVLAHDILVVKAFDSIEHLNVACSVVCDTI